MACMGLKNIRARNQGENWDKPDEKDERRNGNGGKRRDGVPAIRSPQKAVFEKMGSKPHATCE